MSILLRRAVAAVALTALGAAAAAGLAPFVLGEELASGSAVDSAQACHTDVLEVMADVLDLGPADRDRVLSAVATGAGGLLSLSWGSFFLRAGVPPESQLRTAGSSAPALDPTTPMLAGSIDALAAAAGSRGYTCTIPEVRTIRSCTRDLGGYTYRLWMDGTDTAVAELSLEVLATYRTQTRRHWLDEMSVVLSWVGTDQGRNLALWLAQNADAPGADSYVDGLSVFYFVRTDEYVKETFGGVRAQVLR